MLLAEAMAERDYIAERISFIYERITDASLSSLVGKDRTNTRVLNEKFDELEDLWQKYQHYSMIIARAESAVVFKVNDSDVSLRDATVIREILLEKVVYLRSLLDHIRKNGASSDVVLVDVLDVDKKLLEAVDDIKTLGVRMAHASWSSEVS